MVIPSAASSGTPSAVKSYFSPSSASSGTSPAALRPNRKSSPTTTAAACRRSDSTMRTKSSGLSRENSTLKGSTNTASAPRPARSSAWRRGVVRNGGCEPGRMTSSGCGSKVITTSGRPFSCATCSARATTRWWPRCTPSNTPIVATHPAQSAGTSSRPYQRYTIPVPPSSASSAASTSLAFGEHRQRTRLAVLLGQQRHQRAVRGEGGRRAGGGGAGGETAAVGHAAGLVRGQVPAGEGGRGGQGQGHDLEPFGQLVQGFRGIEAVPSDAGAAQSGQVPAGAQAVPQITGQGPDVGAAGAAHGGVDIGEAGEVAVAGRADGGDGELVDGDRAGLELGRGPGPGQLVGALAVDLDRADRGRDLLDLAGQVCDGLADRFWCEAGGRRDCGELAFGVVGIARLAEPDRGVVLLLGQGQVAEQAGGLLDPDHQDAGRHRVQGARVTHPPGAGQPADPRHHVVRGQAAGLVDDDQAVFAVRHSSSSSSSSSSSAGLR